MREQKNAFDLSHQSPPSPNTHTHVCTHSLTNTPLCWPGDTRACETQVMQAQVRRCVEGPRQRRKEEGVSEEEKEVTRRDTAALALETKERPQVATYPVALQRRLLLHWLLHWPNAGNKKERDRKWALLTNSALHQHTKIQLLATETLTKIKYSYMLLKYPVPVLKYSYKLLKR